jgi:peptidoglycan/xylan/chitin deacetylase (PgdA/CDA1 family)
VRKQILTIIAACFYYSGLVLLARWWTQRSGQHLIILNYHRATGGDLRRQLLFFRRHYRILHLEAALENLYDPYKSRDQEMDLRTPLVLTFDDGYRDNYTHGFVLARELGVPMTIFLIPGYVENGAHFWWLEGRRLVESTKESVAIVEGRLYHLRLREEREELSRVIDSRLRNAASVAEREAFLSSVREVLGLPLSSDVQKEAMSPLSQPEIQEMEESGWISFGAHTMHHPVLARLTDTDEVHYEVERCRLVMEQQLGHPVRAFAYPIGQLQHITEYVLQTVRKAGYDWALTTVYGFNTPNSDPYLLRRIEVDVSQHWLVVAAETAGLWGFFSRLRWVPAIRRYLVNSSSK